MSLNNPGLTKTFIAEGAISRFRVVALAAGDNEVKQAAAATDPLIGISAEPGDVVAGDRIDVVFSGIVEAQAGAAIAKGAELTVNASGKVITATTTDERIGRALVAANADGDVISIEINKF